MGGSLDPRPAAISALVSTEFPKRECEYLFPPFSAPHLLQMARVTLESIQLRVAKKELKDLWRKERGEFGLKK